MSIIQSKSCYVFNGTVDESSYRMGDMSYEEFGTPSTYCAET